jgi:hypothetical protein
MMDFTELAQSVLDSRPEVIVAGVALIGAVLTAIVSLVGNIIIALVTYQSAKRQAEATLRSAKEQAEATLRAVQEEVQRRYQARRERAREELREHLERIGSQIVRPCERLLSRLIPICKLARLRCREFNPANLDVLPEPDADAIAQYDNIANMYNRPLDLAAPHPGANARLTFAVYVFRTIGALGRWRDQVVRVVALDDPLILPAVYQFRRLENAFCSTRLPFTPWFSREIVEVIEDAFGSARKRLSWEATIERIRKEPQLEYAVGRIDENFLQLFNPVASFMTVRARQTRGALLALYLMDFLKLLLPEYNFPFIEDREEIWKNVIQNFAQEQKSRNQQVHWYLYKQGDVLESSACPEPPKLAAASFA